MSADEEMTPAAAPGVERAEPDPALTQSADPASFARSQPGSVDAPVTVVGDVERYEVLGEHGRGGLGRVSRAHDRALGRDVAIKELLSRGPISELRFAREARITARLEHPGIVPVYEAGRWPDGTPFYAMKLVSGRPLRALIAERDTVDERIGLLHHVIAVADAMAYAHGRNIIHRDLKPANVIVGEFGETVVIDWGLAKDLSDATTIGGNGSVASSDHDLTKAGSVLGTPAYMPPEQERGEAVDQRADVFAIGAMLWELCSLHKVPPVDPRQRHCLLRRAGIDDDLIAILDKTIDPDPRRRYAAAGELAADLKAFKAGVRIAARRYSLPEMVAHWARRHRLLTTLTLALMAVVVTGVAALAVLYRASSRNADVAEQRLVHAYLDQGRRALLGQEYSQALVYLIEAAHRGAQSSAVRFMLERAAEPLESEILRLQGPGARTWTARFSRDERRILTGDDLGARIWDAETGRRLLDLPHPSVVFHAEYTADNRQVVTFADDGVVRIWDAETGVIVRALSQPSSAEAGYREGALSPDGRFVAAVGNRVGAALSRRPSTGAVSIAYTSLRLGRVRRAGSGFGTSPSA